MLIDSNTLHQITSDVCESMLGFPLAAADRALQFEQPALVAFVWISGDCRALLEVETTPHMAKLIGATMFASDPDALSQEEVLDAIGEVANMIGGNVKGVIPGESSLSLPCVTTRCGPLHHPKQADIVEIHLESAGERMIVRVLEPCEPQRVSASDTAVFLPLASTG